MENTLRTGVRCFGRLAALCVLLFAQALAAAATVAPVAMVSDLQGKGAVIAGAARSPLALLADVEAGAQVELDSGARMVLLYLDGSGEYVFSGPALISVRQQQPQTVKGAPAQKRSVLGGKAGDVRLKPLGTVQGAIVMRSVGGRGRIRLTSPSGTRTTESPPEFRWHAEQAGLTYRFALTDVAGKTLHESDVADTSLKLPATVKLADDVTYTWSVSAPTPDGRRMASNADFTIVPASLRQQITALRPAPAAPVSERVAFASWLEQLELKDEARAIWRALADERPDDQRLQSLARD